MQGNLNHPALCYKSLEIDGEIFVLTVSYDNTFDVLLNNFCCCKFGSEDYW